MSLDDYFDGIGHHPAIPSWYSDDKWPACLCIKKVCECDEKVCIESNLQKTYEMIREYTSHSDSWFALWKCLYCDEQWCTYIEG